MPRRRRPRRLDLRVEALWGGSAILRLAPTGAMIETIPVPVRQPTSIRFAGATMVITSARMGLSDPGPLDGAVLALDAPIGGRLASNFQLGAERGCS